MKTPPNGYNFAHPQPSVVEDGKIQTPSDYDQDLGGVTKREYFAALAMQGLLASDHEASMHQNDCAKIAVAHADALLKELEE